MDANVYKGFSEDQLKKAFDAVSDPEDWRGPIYARVPGEAVMACVAAVEFYTGTTPTVSLNMITMRYAIESEGYRAGPCGDH